MNPTPTIAINEIRVEDRQRIDLGDIDSLAESIATYGLIQPVVLNRDNRLIAGGRRLTACTKLGWTHIPAVYRDTLSEEELTCLELEENIRRKEMTWKEEVASIYKIHKLKSRNAHLAGDEWSQEHTGRLLGVSRASVGFTIQIAKELLNQSSRIHDCAGYTEALRWCFQKKEDEVQAELAARMKQQMDANRMQTTVRTVEGSENTNLQVLPEGTGDFTVDLVPVHSGSDMVVDLSSTIILGDALSWLAARSPESVDHILTDPPYAIDMEQLEQNNPHGGMANVERIEDTHQVDSNLNLLTDFFPLAFSVLRPKGFCVVFCDPMRWQFLYDQAVAAGFRVQRWPIVWHKTSQCMNQRAEFNFTKNYELALVARKPSATLVSPQQTSIFACPRTGYTSNPFAKPFDLWSFFIKAISIQGQTILDPFAGEGSCPNAVLSNWRIPIAVESDPRHYNVMLDSVRSKYKTFYRNPVFV